MVPERLAGLKMTTFKLFESCYLRGKVVFHLIIKKLVYLYKELACFLKKDKPLF